MESPRNKVKTWLDQSNRQNLCCQITNPQYEDWLLCLVETTNLYHLSDVALDRGFSVSQAGTIAVACSAGTPLLSVVRPSNDRVPVILSQDKPYRSAIFLKISGKEYLAAGHSNDTDSSLDLWDVENETSRVVHKHESRGRQRMNLCVINETVTYIGSSLLEGKIVVYFK